MKQPQVRRRVGVIMGGSSGEREVSLRSGSAMADALEARGHEVVRMALGEDFGAELASMVTRSRIDVAMLAYVIARGISRVNPDEALLAGLLQDIGHFYLLSRVKSYPDVANDPQELDALLDEWHVGIGCSILVSMDLPAATVNAVERHHAGSPPSPLVTPLRDLAEVLMVANGAARHFSSQQGAASVRDNPDLPPVDPVVLQLLVTSVDELKALAAELRG